MTAGARIAMWSWRSTGFGDTPGPLPELPRDHAPILEAALPIYERLAAFKIAPTAPSADP
jgi:hypothetical protein